MCYDGMRMLERKRFEQLVEEAFDSLPDWVLERLDNVGICVEDESEDGLLGLYLGVPQIERWGDEPILPDKIVIFQKEIEEEVGSDDEKKLQAEVFHTLWHEIAHHFGWEEADLERMERKRGWLK